MSKKNKALIIFLSIVGLTKLGEMFLPIAPFIAIGCFGTYMLGRWEKANGL
jgi:hypothetical protein